MKNLRIAIGYTTAHRATEAAVVLAAGTDSIALQQAINQAGPEFVRFEFGVFTFQRKAVRTAARNSTKTETSGTVEEKADTSAAPPQETVPSAGAPGQPGPDAPAAGEAGESDEDGPRLDLNTPPAPPAASGKSKK